MTVRSDALRTGSQAVGQAELATLARRVADRPELWRNLVRFEPDKRFYAQLEQGAGYEIWLLTWLAGQQTGFHDHGESSGAFVVAGGCLTERAAVAGRPEPAGRQLPTGAVRSFGPHYVHDVCNDQAEPAISIHAYSPALTSMRRFEVSEAGLLRVTGEDRTW